MVALDRATLQPKDWFTADGADFNTSPVVIRHKDKDLVAAAGNDGRLYLLDGASLGGADHKTPLHVTAKYTAAGAGGGAGDLGGRGHAVDLLAPAVGAPAGGSKLTRATAPRPAAASSPSSWSTSDGKIDAASRAGSRAI